MILFWKSFMLCDVYTSIICHYYCYHYNFIVVIIFIVTVHFDLSKQTTQIKKIPNKAS